MPIKNLSSLDGSGAAISLTGSSAPRLLLPGESAIIEYSAATDVPLNVTTEEGLYELKIIGSDASIAVPNTNSLVLLPNNTTVTAGQIEGLSMTTTMGFSDGGAAVSPSGWKDGTSRTSISMSGGIIVSLIANISTFTKNKSCVSTSLRKTATAAITSGIDTSFWSDSATVWASLGTLSFPFAQSGKIIIRRIM